MTYGGEPPALISMPEIAELAGVRRPVVTTWRRRHADFPTPVRRERGSPLFDAGQVVDWLVATDRAERSRIEPDLRLHLITSLMTDSAMRRSAVAPWELVAVLTALVCLRHLDDEPLYVPGQRSWPLVASLRERAGRVDPDDMLLRAEIESLGADQSWLAAAVDGLVEAAWGCRQAYERILAARGRMGAGDLDPEAVDESAAALVVGLSGAREHADTYGSVCVADPAAGAGDLLVAVLDALGEDAAVSATVGEADPWLARLLHRRLVVRDVPDAGTTVHRGASPVVGQDADVLVSRMPYEAKEQRGEADPFDWLHRLTDTMAPGQTAVVLGPADLLVGALPPYRAAWRTRNQLLTDGRVEAVISLPGGLVPYRPAYQTGLWVLRREDPSPWQGRVLLADVSDRPLAPQVVDDLVWDVVTWRRHGHRPAQHLRTHATQVKVADLVRPRVALSTRRPARLRDLTGPQRAVARVVELETDLDAATRERPAAGLRTGLATRQEQATVSWRTIATLVRDGLLAIRKGSRLAPAHVTSDGHHRVIGSPELCWANPVGARTVDRQVLAAHYPQARLTEAGDVVATLTPHLGLHLDRDGYAVVEFPARVLRVPEGGRTRFTPRVLAALLAALPHVGYPTARAAGAVRTPTRLVDLPLPLLPPAEVVRLDELLAAAEAHREQARREIQLTDELCHIATTGLADGTLTMADPPKARRDRTQ